MNSRTRLLFLLAGLAAATVLVAHVGLGVLLADVRHAGWTLVPVVLVWAVVYAMNTGAWLLLVEGARIPAARAYAISVSAFALNSVTPFVALGGEPLRASSAAAWVGARRATASVVAFRVAHTVGQIAFWLLCIPLGFVLLPHTPLVRALLAATALVLAALVLLLVVALRAGTAERLLALMLRTPVVRRAEPWLERHREAMRALDEALAALAAERPARLALAVAVEAASRFAATLEFLLIARSVGAPVGYAGAAVITAFSQLAINVLFFMPFEVGAKEGSLYAVFALLGYTPRVALAGAVVSRLRELVWITIGLALTTVPTTVPNDAA